MKEKKYFYFASPHSFKYPFLVNLIFTKRSNRILHRNDHSSWIEVWNYNYYGEPVKCIIPEQLMEYGFVFKLLSSHHTDNVFGAINYLLCNYREKFIQHLSNGLCPSVAANIATQYFKKDLQIDYGK